MLLNTEEKLLSMLEDATKLKSAKEAFWKEINSLKDENAMLKLNLNMSEDLVRVLTKKAKELEVDLEEIERKFQNRINGDFANSNINKSRIKKLERKIEKLEKELNIYKQHYKFPGR